MFERYSFVAVTTRNLERARRFWVDALGFPVTEEKSEEYFIVDAGGLRLCIDLADGDVHKSPGSDPVIGLKVRSVRTALAKLKARGLEPKRGPVEAGRTEYAELEDPDGRIVIITEGD